MQCPTWGRQLSKAEQFWMATQGSRQCYHCWAGVRFLRSPRQEHVYPAPSRKGAPGRRSARDLAA